MAKHRRLPAPVGSALFLRVAFALSVLLLSFVVADSLYFRLRYGPVDLYLENHAVYHHRLIPGKASITWLPGEYYTVVRANSLGLRGSELESPKRADSYRIVMLGDSFTMGKGVEEEETFSSRLAERLNSEALSLPHPRYEVVNAGIDSFSPLLEYLLLREEWGELDPDLVVLNFDMSDLVQDTYYQSQVFYTEAGELRGASTRDGQSLDMSGYDGLGRWLNRNTFYTAMAFRWLFPPGEWVVAHMATPELLRHTLAGSENDFDREWRLTLRNLHRIARMCAAREVPFVLSVYPWAHQVSPELSRTAMREFLEPGYALGRRSVGTLRNFARAYDVPFLDATPAFRDRYSANPDLYYDLDLHWTPAGHEVMAEALEPVVAQAIRADRSRIAAQ